MRVIKYIFVFAILNVFAQTDSIKNNVFYITTEIGNYHMNKAIYFNSKKWVYDKDLKNKVWFFKHDSLNISLSISFYEKSEKILGKKVAKDITREDYLKLLLDRTYDESKKAINYTDTSENISLILFDITKKMLFIEGDDLANNSSIILVYFINEKGIIIQMVFSGEYQNGFMKEPVLEFIRSNDSW